ncbi:MAG: hypothetical protein LBF50_01385 [Azoarcus sp.]|nr:hypothetical protein [Azoarcus sp.]
MAGTSSTDSLESVACLRKAIGILNGKKRTPEEEYLLGYAWYHLPNNIEGIEERDQIVEIQLKKALEFGKRNANYLYAKELLGCQYYDIGQYDAALSLFSTFENDTFSKHYDQKWKDIKIAELKLCCILRLGRIAEIEVNVKYLYDIFEMSIDDVSINNGQDAGFSINLAHPSELIDTLKVLLESAGNAATQNTLGTGGAAQGGPVNQTA